MQCTDCPFRISTVNKILTKNVFTTYAVKIHNTKPLPIIDIKKKPMYRMPNR